MRGGAEQFMEETERSLHDAIMIVRRAIKNDAIVAGVDHCVFNFSNRANTLIEHTLYPIEDSVAFMFSFLFVLQH